MKRRSFLVGAILTPGSAIASLPQDAQHGLRVSVDKGDPGYRNYCVANGDGKIIKVYLDGVEQKHCRMADESLGVVRRIVTTPSGKLAHANGEVLEEEVSGVVRVITVDR